MADPSKQAAGLRPSPAGGGPTDARVSASIVRRLPVIPERYALREKEGLRYLECDEAPRLRAVIDPQMSVSRSEAAALGERVILLDGAGSFGPLIDNERKLYNLDHHAGCERLFTLSTCEQALLLVHSGLELSEGDWTLYANDPDLDTVLALWCLMNYRRVRELRDDARDLLMPVFRLEGAIDSNGPELARLCGLPTHLLEQTRRRIEDLMARERGLKQSGSWATKNVHAYTLEMLRAIDAMVYTREDFGDHTRIEEIYGHVEFAPRRVAVVCRDPAGIYTVEQHLKTRWGDQLSIIALENQPGHYTLRRLSSVAGPQLLPAYELLNRVDPAVDGRPPGKQWGGSQDIGGSPRPQGTRLSPQEVLELLARAYRTSTWWARAGQAVGALLVGLSFLIFWPLSLALAALAPRFTVPPGVESAYEISLASLVAMGVGMVATRAASQRRAWAFGWRSPANGGGWWMSPLALLGAWPASAWISLQTGAGVPEVLVDLVACALGIAAGEVWFRGLVHGILAVDFPVQRPGGRWRLSRATLVSAAAYALVVTALALAGLGNWGPEHIGTGRLAWIGGIAAVAFLAGLALGFLRERSLSLLPGIAIQLLGIVLATAVWYAVAGT